MTFKVEGSCAVFSPPSSLSPAESSGKDVNQDDRSRIKLQCPAEIPLVGYRLMHKHSADIFLQVYSCSLGPTKGSHKAVGLAVGLGKLIRPKVIKSPSPHGLAHQPRWFTGGWPCLIAPSWSHM